MTEMTTETTEVTALDKAQTIFVGAAVMPGSEGASLIVATSDAADLSDRVTALQTAATEQRQEAYAAKRALSNRDDVQQNALKALVKNEEIDLDTAKTVADALGLDADDLKTTYEVTLTITVRVTGVVADDEDEAGNAVAEALSVDIYGGSVEYSSLDQEDVNVDDCTPED